MEIITSSLDSIYKSTIFKRYRHGRSRLSSSKSILFVKAALDDYYLRVSIREERVRRDTRSTCSTHRNYRNEL